MILLDDYGWANAGWHNNVTTSGEREVQTPNLDRLVRTGIELNNHYTFKFCSPTRSALQSGRNPIHVNVQNVAPNRYNPEDPVAGFSAVARNMTGMATLLQRAGYATAAVGKWDAGMATPDHTPQGRGYDQSLIYFHHANDYWTYQTGTCMAASDAIPGSAVASADECSAGFEIKENTGACHQPKFANSTKVANQDECCTVCAQSSGCVAWTFQHDSSMCYFCTQAQSGPNQNRTSGCLPGACKEHVGITDLWSDGSPAKQHQPRPECKQQNASQPWPEDNYDCLYEDALFEAEVQRIVGDHDFKTRPLFLFWAPHIVHGPAQVPRLAYEELDFITHAETTKRAAERQKYLARVKYIDASVGRLVDLLTSKGAWGNSLLVLSSDNGGPLGSANNWPLRGGKSSNFQGGVRVNAFASGGALPVAVRGSRLDELVTIWDWYATFAAIAGVDDVTDHRAAAAGLPPVDSVNQWPLLTGQLTRGSRSVVPLGSCSDADVLEDRWCQTKGHQLTTVSGMISWIGEGSERHLWKLLIDMHPVGGWTGPKWPNATAAHLPDVDCGVPPTGSGCLFDLTVDPEERADLASDAKYASQRDGLLALIQKHNATTHSPDRGEVDEKACTAATSIYGNHWGPWVDVPSIAVSDEALIV